MSHHSFFFLSCLLSSSSSSLSPLSLSPPLTLTLPLSLSSLFLPLSLSFPLSLPLSLSPSLFLSLPLSPPLSPPPSNLIHEESKLSLEDDMRGESPDLTSSRKRSGGKSKEDLHQRRPSVKSRATKASTPSPQLEDTLTMRYVYMYIYKCTYE